MDDTSRWVIGAMISVLTICLAYLFKIVVDVRTIVAGMSGEITRLKDDIGRDSHSGIRGRAHKNRGQIGVLAAQIDDLRDRTGMRYIGLADSLRKERE